MTNRSRLIGLSFPAVIRLSVSVLFLTGLLFWGPQSASGQKLPQTAAPKADTPAVSSLPSILESDAGIDGEIDRIRTHVNRLRAEGGVTGGAISADGGVQLEGADTDETKNRKRIASELVLDLDKQIDTLNELKQFRKDNASDRQERQAWTGFTEKPPFTIAFLDDIRDSLLSQKLALNSFEVRLSLAKASWKRYNEDLKKARKAVRLAEEARSRSIGTPQEQRHRLLLGLARLQSDRDEAGLVLAELQRIAYETAIKGKNRKIAFLEEKLRTAEASSPLSKEDLEKKLGDLDSQRREMEAELLTAQKSEIEATKKLDDLRSVLAGLPAVVEEKMPSVGTVRKLFQSLSPKKEKKVSREEQIRSLRLDIEAQQAFVETARLKIAAIKGGIQLVNAAEGIWHDRYWLNTRRDLRDIREKQAELTETLTRIGLVMKYADTNLENLMSLIRSQKDRILSLDRASPARKIQELILNTYEERQEINLRLIDGLGRVERLASRLNDELSRRVSEASFTNHLKERLQKGYFFLIRIWGTELYVATETTIVGDRSIVKPVSVTVGKVVKALILLIIGTWIAGKIGRVIQWVLTRRLNWTSNSAKPVGKVIFGVMFICVFVVSLISVNIPLAVFTFFGGALAIGIGFGAQHIINNFISGMILLFDRSIKVGDIVEVDGQGGRVTEIGMRNSHIKRFDGIDMLVPNSQFLQQKVTNWTLSDRQMRYTVSVGVTYGSPTRETELIIMKAVEQHPMVLKDPPPMCLFEEFGDSSLVFTGYFWMEIISNRDNRIAVSEIRHAISESLGKAGITISFPQRDVHLDTVRPLEVKVVLPEKGRETTSFPETIV